jgi:hypothetical protein
MGRKTFFPTCSSSSSKNRKAKHLLNPPALIAYVDSAFRKYNWGLLLANRYSKRFDRGLVSNIKSASYIQNFAQSIQYVTLSRISSLSEALNNYSTCHNF